MNAIMLFALATVVNVVLSTIRSICTIKCGKWVSAFTNAVCYGFYPLIVMLTAEGTVGILINMLITAIANFVCVWFIKLIEEKSRKDKMWRVDLAIPNDERDFVHRKLKDIPHNYVECGSWTMFNCYCATQEDTAKVKQIGVTLGGKYSAYESQPM